MKKLIIVLILFLSAFLSDCSGSEINNPIWMNLKIIFEYGGLPAVILLFGLLYLRSVNKQWGDLVSQNQSRFEQQQLILIQALQNNTAALSVLTTKFGMGCSLFRDTSKVSEQGEIDVSKEKNRTE